MNPERWNQIESLFFQAVDLDPDKRHVWLMEQCGDDVELRAQVDRLLTSDAEPTAMLADAVGASVRELDFGRERPAKRIGPYEVLAEIGRGGMGIVYRARRDDDVFRKEVAIKVVKGGTDTGKIVTRFLHERRILARLEHPCIARILDGGSTEAGLPYLVMEYVEGIPLTDYCAQHKLSLQGRLDLFCKVCSAVDYAHQHLVVHRDLKPSNILVDALGEPKLLDFGIAKLLTPDEGEYTTTLTSEGTRVLTPQYGSPEQVTGEPITTASDIYSLGAILYELLTGCHAHRIKANTPVSLMRAICEEEVATPSKAVRTAKSPPVAQHELVGDLDKILLTALRKDPKERYGSVHLLADDLRRFMADLPVLARSQTLRYRTLKFLRRNRMPVIAAALAVASLIGGTAISIYQARRAERRFHEVRTLANSFLFEVHDQIETLPGSTRARDSLVRTVLRYLNNLARESSDDPSLQWELATAYQKVGDVQGYGFRPNLGQTSAAMDSQRKALAIAEELAARGYDPKVQRLLALTNDRIGLLIEGAQAGVEGGSVHYRRAQELLERLNQESPGDPDNSPLLIMVYGHQGNAEYLRGRLAEAAARWQQTLDIAQQWYDRNPSDAARNALGLAHRRVSTAAQLTGDLAKALKHARAAIEIHEPLAASEPSNTARQREILNSYEQLSYVAGNPSLLNLGDLATALAYNRKVVAIAEALREADPNNTMAGSDLVVAKRYTCTFVPDDDAPLVVRACQESLASATRHGRDPIEVQPSAAQRLGPALSRLGRRAEAEKTMEHASELLNDAIRKWPWRTDLRLQLLRVHNEYGTMLLRVGDPGEALKHYREGAAIGEALLHVRPQDLAVRRDLADCYTNLGRYWEKRDTSQARQWYKKDLEIWSEWPRRATSSGLDQGRREQASRNIARCDERTARTN